MMRMKANENNEELKKISTTVDEKKPNFLKKAMNKILDKDDGKFTAESAWIKSTYGSNVNLTVDERIINKQRYIRDTIKAKFRRTTGGSDVYFGPSSYRCVIDIEEDIEAYADVILKPFIENGFKVINLSEAVNEIKDEHVYLISWKNVFKKS